MIDVQGVVPYVKKSIPKGLKEQVWIKHIGEKFNAKCTISWCTNTITPFNYHCAHIIAESKDGPTTLDNLVPTCSKCNLSMSNNYSVTEWCNLIHKHTRWGKLGAKMRMICSIMWH
jgi:hypothetical protein